MLDWKTIESAPVDGTECWVSVWSDNKVGGERLVERGFFNVGSGRWCAADDEAAPLYTPTHWMPFIVPAPPAE